MKNIQKLFALSSLLFAAVLMTATPLVSAVGIGDEASLLLKQDAAWVDRTKPAGCGVGGGANIPNGTPDENGQAIFNFFVENGLTPFQAAGIIGNMVVESGLLPQRLQSTPASKITTAAEAANNPNGWGLVQFTPAGKFIKYSTPPYKSTTEAPYESANLLSTQLDFIWEQLNGGTHIPEAQAGREIKGTTNIEDAVRAFQGNRAVGGQYFGYERPADQSGSISLRIRYAKSALQKYGSGAAAGGAADAISSTTPSAAVDCNADADLEVMTYNILGADLAPRWEQRLRNVVQTVQTRNPLIVGFQEVHSAGQRTGLRDALKDKFDWYPQPTDTASGAGRPLYWNKEQFEKKSEGTYDIPKGGGTVAQPWVILEHKTSKRQFFVTNAHLAVGNSNQDSDDRRDGARKMVDTIALNNKQDAPVIMLGDYNSTCVKTSGDRSDADLPCKIFEKAGYRDSEIHAADKVGEEYATSHGGVDSINRSIDHHIDHVFIDQSIPKVARWENIVDATTRTASDHTPVFVSLVAGIAPQGGGEGWQWPVKGNIRTGNCWNVFVSGLGRHAGMDINSTVNGNEAIAAHNGTVVEIDRVGTGAGGRYVIVKADTTPALYYSYQHLSSVAVDMGQQVTAGQTKVGIIGTTGRVINGGAGHLHFVVAVAKTLGSYSNNGQTRDPMKYLPEDAPDNYKCIGGTSAQ